MARKTISWFAAMVLCSGATAFGQAPDAASPQPDTGAAAAEQPVRRADWAMALGGPTRYSAYPETLNAANLALAWQYSTTLGASADARIAPVVGDGVVYFAVGHSVYAVDAHTGAMKWTRAYNPPPPPGEAIPPISSSPAYSNGFLYVASDDGMLHVLNAATGTETSQATNLGSPAKSAPVVVDGTLILGTDDGSVKAFVLAGGDTGGIKPLWSAAAAPGDEIRGPISVFGSTAYATSATGKVIAMDRGSGRITAVSDLNTALQYGALPTADTVYVAAGNRLFSLMPASLRPKGQVQSFSGEISAAPAYSDGILYLVTRFGGLFAYDTAYQTYDWAVSLGASAGPRAAPVVAGDTLIVAASSGHVYAFARRGDGRHHFRLLWRYTALPTPLYQSRVSKVPDILSQPAVYGHSVFLLSDNGTMNCLTEGAPDFDPPTVENRYPVGGPYPAEPAPTLTARVRDIGSGLRGGTLSVQIDGRTIPMLPRGSNSLDGYLFDDDTGLLSYTPRRPFTDGSHTVTISATDNRGNSTNQTWTFSVSHSVRRAQYPGDYGTNGAYGGGASGFPGGAARGGYGGGAPGGANFPGGASSP